jgi:hypothetical protein
MLHHSDHFGLLWRNSKNFACLEINFIKIFPKIALKYVLEKNVVLYEIYSKKSKVTNTFIMYCLLLILTERNVVVGERDWLKKIPVDIQFSTYDVFPE